LKRVFGTKSGEGGVRIGAVQRGGGKGSKELSSKKTGHDLCRRKRVQAFGKN